MTKMLLNGMDRAVICLLWLRGLTAIVPLLSKCGNQCIYFIFAIFLCVLSLLMFKYCVTWDDRGPLLLNQCSEVNVLS